MTDAPGASRRQRRPRPQSTCNPCHSRKIKCDQRKPCDQCIRHRREGECTYRAAPLTQEQQNQIFLHPVEAQVEMPMEMNGPNFAGTRSVSSSGTPIRPDQYAGSAHSDLLSRGTPSSSTQGLAHSWDRDLPVRGRSHYSWLLQQFDPLLSYVKDQRNSSQGQDEFMSIESGAYDDHSGIATSENSYKAYHRANVPTNWYEEIPQRHIADMLYERYFQTFNTVCSILRRPTFEMHYKAMMTDFRNVKICFIMETLMVLALGNATLAVDDQVISPEVALGWLDLASSGPSTAMDLREFDIDTVRMWALLNFTRQLLKFDAVADYIYTGSALRSGMLIGLHRPSEWAKGGNRKGLWEALVGLDLQACLSTGSPPTVLPYSLDDHVNAGESLGLGDDGSVESSTSNIQLGRAFSQSLAVRYKITHLLNVEKEASFDAAMELSRELTRIMAPSTSIDDTPLWEQPFQVRFVSFIYKSCLAALHRPFAFLPSHAYHFSRTVALSLAQQHVETMIAALEQNGPLGYFDMLLRGPGSILTIEIYDSIMILCLQLYNTTFDELAMDAILSGGTENRMLSYRIVQRFLTLYERNHTNHQYSLPQPYIAASLTLAHFETVRRSNAQTTEYRQHMSKKAQALIHGVLLNP